MSILRAIAESYGVKISENLHEYNGEDLCDNIVLEYGIIYDPECKISIHVTPDGTHYCGEGGGYFKVAFKEKYKRNDLCARLNFMEPKYELHNHHKNLSKSQKDKVVKIMNSTVTDTEYNSLIKTNSAATILIPYIKTKHIGIIPYAYII